MHVSNKKFIMEYCKEPNVARKNMMLKAFKLGGIARKGSVLSAHVNRLIILASAKY